MRILYGVQGTGNGHLAMARVLLPGLERQGAEVDFVFSGRPTADYFDADIFQRVRVFKGVTLAHDVGKISVIKTMAGINLWRLGRDVLSLDVADYDLVLSDFEPITAWASQLVSKPSIGISHQLAFSYDVPKVQGYWGSRQIMKSFAPVDIKIGLHYKPYDAPLLPPLLDKSHSLTVGSKNAVLVYLHYDNIDDLIQIFLEFPWLEFHVFSKVNSQKHIANVCVYPLSFKQFDQSFEHCFHVITQAGFALTARCLAAGKRLLIQPMAGQFEQLSNALALAQFPQVETIYQYSRPKVVRWLAQCSQAIEDDDLHHTVFPDYVDELSAWIVDPKRSPLTDLSDKVWALRVSA